MSIRPNECWMKTKYESSPNHNRLKIIHSLANNKHASYIYIYIYIYIYYFAATCTPTDLIGWLGIENIASESEARVGVHILEQFIFAANGWRARIVLLLPKTMPCECTTFLPTQAQ
jgi:hypothetical protein